MFTRFLSQFSNLFFWCIFVFIAVNNVATRDLISCNYGEIMKRFFVTLILSTVIVGVLTYSMPRGLEFYIEEIDANATITIYCRSTDVESIDMGNGKIVRCSVANFDRVLARCSGVDGFSVCFEGTAKDVDRVSRLFDLKVTSTLNLDGLQIVCGNSAKLKGGVNLDGDMVNMQIAFKDGVVTVGSPLILGDY